MWLYPLIGLLVVLGLIGTLLGGGIFTIALIPIGAIILFTSLAFGLWSRSSQGAAGGDTDAGPSSRRPLPRRLRGQPSRVPTSPEGLTEARRTQQ